VRFVSIRWSFEEDCNALRCSYPDCNRIIQTEANNHRHNNNNLVQHQNRHRPRNLTCPGCGEQRFNTASGVALHFERGHCTACRDQETAEAAVFGLINRRLPQFLNHAICDEDITHEFDNNYVPAQAYRCPHCNKIFNRFSSLNQHLEARHGQPINVSRMLGN